MRKNYNQPKTEIALFQTEALLQGLIVSTNPSGGGGGSAHAPRRGEIIP